jgi:tetratricopeptide (TPR) repeat protein
MAASEEFLKRAVEKNPFYVPAFAAYGRILYDDGRYDDASRILQEGLEVQPFNPRLHETLALISMDLGNIPAARRSLELALRFDPQSADLRDLMRHLPKGRAR